jgi:hypothetical protein
MWNHLQELARRLASSASLARSLSSVRKRLAMPTLCKGQVSRLATSCDGAQVSLKEAEDQSSAYRHCGPSHGAQGDRSSG